MFFRRKPRSKELTGHADSFENGRLEGWVADLTSPQRTVHAALYIDGSLAHRARADLRRDDLLGIELTAYHGYKFDLLPLPGKAISQLELRVEDGEDAASLSLPTELSREIIEFLSGRHPSNLQPGHELHALPGRKLTQFFRPGEMRWTGISLWLHAPPDAASDHSIDLRLYRLSDGALAAPDEDVDLGVLVFRQLVAPGDVDDAGRLHIYFPPVHSQKDSLFAIKMWMAGEHTGDPVCVWLSSRSDNRIPGHVRCVREDRLGLLTGLFAELFADPRPAPYPVCLLYSPLSSCNMNCVHCISRHSRDRVQKLPSNVKADIKAHVASGHLTGIYTDYSGDILFADLKNPGELDFLFELGIAIHIDTNGAYLNDQTIERLMTSSVNAVGISVDAATDATYKIIRVGSPPIDQVFSSAKKLVEARARHGRQTDVSIHMSFVLMRSNIGELSLFIEKAAAAGVDAVSCRHLEIYDPRMKDESLYLDKPLFNEARRECLGLAKQLGITLNISGELKRSAKSRAVKPCRIPWSSAVLLANGDVMACCVPGSKMGNLSEESLEDIWHGHAYERLRATVNSTSPPSLCATCHFRHDLDDFASLDELYAGLDAKPLLDDLAIEAPRTWARPEVE